MAWTEDELAGRAGHAITEAERAMLHTLTLPETLTFFHGELGLGKSEQDVADMMEDYLMRYYAERSVMRPGALEFVRELRARGIRCSIASSTPHAMLVAGCEHTGLAPLVSAIVSTDDVGASKREPAVYDRARELMGTPVAATWVFEDAAYALRTLACTDYRTVGIWDQDEAGTFEELSDLADVAIRSYAELDVERFVAGGYARKAERAYDGPGRQAPAGRPRLADPPASRPDGRPDGDLPGGASASRAVWDIRGINVGATASIGRSEIGCGVDARLLCLLTSEWGPFGKVLGLWNDLSECV